MKSRAREATAWYLEDTASFGLGMPDEQPLATQTIPEIVALIEELIAANNVRRSLTVVSSDHRLQRAARRWSMG